MSRREYRLAYRKLHAKGYGWQEISADERVALRAVIQAYKNRSEQQSKKFVMPIIAFVGLGGVISGAMLIGPDIRAGLVTSVAWDGLVMLVGVVFLVVWVKRGPVAYLRRRRQYRAMGKMLQDSPGATTS